MLGKKCGFLSKQKPNHLSLPSHIGHAETAAARRSSPRWKDPPPAAPGGPCGREFSSCFYGKWAILSADGLNSVGKSLSRLITQNALGVVPALTNPQISMSQIVVRDFSVYSWLTVRITVISSCLSMDSLRVFGLVTRCGYATSLKGNLWRVVSMTSLGMRWL